MESLSNIQEDKSNIVWHKSINIHNNVYYQVKESVCIGIRIKSSIAINIFHSVTIDAIKNIIRDEFDG